MIQKIDEIETVGANCNITGRKKTEQKLNESEEKYRNAYTLEWYFYKN